MSTRDCIPRGLRFFRCAYATPSGPVALEEPRFLMATKPALVQIVVPGPHLHPACGVVFVPVISGNGNR